MLALHCGHLLPHCFYHHHHHHRSHKHHPSRQAVLGHLCSALPQLDAAAVTTGKLPLDSLRADLPACWPATQKLYHKLPIHKSCITSYHLTWFDTRNARFLLKIGLTKQRAACRKTARWVAVYEIGEGLSVVTYFATHKCEVLDHDRLD